VHYTSFDWSSFIAPLTCSKLFKSSFYEVNCFEKPICIGQTATLKLQYAFLIHTILKILVQKDSFTMS